ncbi:MAG: WYL domain-containing protein [Acidimicrobiales bacterium]
MRSPASPSGAWCGSATTTSIGRCIYRLEFVRGRWYLNGFDRTRGEDRWFRMDRVDGPVTTDGEREAFQRPAEAVAGLQLDPWVLGGGAIRCERAWFDPDVAPIVRRDLDEGAIVDDDDEGLVIELEVTNRDGFRSWVLSFLDRAEVLGPPELRDELVGWLTALAGDDA